MVLKTRKPTGRASYPTILLAGVAGGGKTWAAVEASAMEQVHRTFFIEIGESSADAYGSIPNADFEIVEHDGSLGGVIQAVHDASRETAPEGKFNVLILDSLTEVWDMLKDNAMIAMRDRLKRKGRRLNGAEPKPDMDLWNRAADASNTLMRALANFRGVVICTARLDEVTMMQDGQPTRERDYKIQIHKAVPFRAQVIVEARLPRQWTLTKIVTTNPDLALVPDAKHPERMLSRALPEFSVPKLLEAMGVTAGMDGSTYKDARADDSLTDGAMEARQQPPQQKPPQQQRSPHVPFTDDQIREQSAKIMAAEAAGNLEVLEAGRAWYSQRGERKLAMMCTTAIEKVNAARAKAELAETAEQVQEQLA